MADWADEMIESLRQTDEFLLEWREEIAAVERYTHSPVHPNDAVRVAPEYVVPRLGPVLTAIARRARTLYESHVELAQSVGQDHPDFHGTSNRAWGARQVLALGLGVHLGLTVQHADWLAEGLTGYQLDRDWPALQQARKRQRAAGAGDDRPSPSGDAAP